MWSQCAKNLHSRSVNSLSTSSWICLYRGNGAFSYPGGGLQFCVVLPKGPLFRVTVTLHVVHLLLVIAFGVGCQLNLIQNVIELLPVPYDAWSNVRCEELHASQIMRMDLIVTTPGTKS